MEWNDDIQDIEPFEIEHDSDDETTPAYDEPSTSNESRPVKKRGRKDFFTSRLAAALDNAKVSDGMATHILIAAAEALGHRVEELVINRSSIHRARQENRFKESSEISTAFNDNVSFPIQCLAK